MSAPENADELISALQEIRRKLINLTPPVIESNEFNKYINIKERCLAIMDNCINIAIATRVYDKRLQDETNKKRVRRIVSEII